MYIQNNANEVLRTAPPIVLIPTATVVVANRDNHFHILVGKSSKHQGYVLPGGKIDQQDVQSQRKRDWAETCIKRELNEEVGVQVSSLEFVGCFDREDADVRSITVECLKDTIVSMSLSHYPKSLLLAAHYGRPDYLFSALVDPKDVRDSSELFQFKWIDIREPLRISLSAGHENLLEEYLQYRREKS